MPARLDGLRQNGESRAAAVARIINDAARNAGDEQNQEKH